MAASASGPRSHHPRSDRQQWRGRQSFPGRFLAGLYQYRFSVGWASLLIASILLFSWLVWLLLVAPRRTPVVFLAAAPYQWPLPPNTLAAEDLGKLAALDGKTITIRGADEPVSSRRSLLDRLERQIEMSRRQDAGLPLIVWLSMHGVYDPGTDKAYLIPPQAAPRDVANWVDVNEVFQRLEAVQDRNVLLVLDCHRLQVNWNIGLTSNPFSSHVQKRFEQWKSPNLAVVLAAGPDQRGAVSPFLQGSVFGHYARRALAGAADAPDRLGVRDGWVTLDELHQYLSDRVNRWSSHNLGARQTPLMLLGADELDFRLTKSLNGYALESLLANDSKTSRLVPTISPKQLDELWGELSKLRDDRLYQREPLAWRDLEHRLLWLEQLASAGSSYSGLALRTADSLATKFRGIEERLDRAQRTRSGVGLSNVIAGGAVLAPEPQRLHSISLSEFFGYGQTESVSQVRNLVQSVTENPRSDVLHEVMRDLDKRRGIEFESEQFLRMMHRYDFNTAWSDPSRTSRLLSLRLAQQNAKSLRDSSGAAADERLLGWSQLLRKSVGDALRNAEDQYFVQGQPEFEEHLKEAEKEQEAFSASMEQLQHARQICDQVMAETPYLAQWLGMPGRREAVFDLDTAVYDDLLRLIEDNKALSERLDATSSGSGSLSETLAFSAARVEKPFQDLRDSWLDACERLLDSRDPSDAALTREIRVALSVPLLTAEDRGRLRSALKRLSESRLLQYDESQSESLAETVVPEGGSAELAEGTPRWRSHPLWMILGQDKTESPSGREAIDGFLRDIGEQIKAGTEPGLATRRQSAEGAARRFRAATAIWFATPKQNPIAVRRRFDWLGILLSHADESLADFWGPAGRERMYFDLATTDFLTAAEEFARLTLDMDAPEQQAEFAALASRLEANKQAAFDRLATESKRAVQIDPGDAVHASVEVGSSELDLDSDAPRGTAALFVRDSKLARVAPVMRPAAVQVPTSKQGVSIDIPPALAQNNLEVVTMFRGHEYAKSLIVQPLSGVAIDISPHEYKKSEVTLNSPGDQLSVIFVLDCSRSMDNPLGISAAGPTSRLDVAKAALEDILFTLGLRQNVRAGVQLFGHRLGWSTDAPLRPLMRPDYNGVIDEGLNPSEDVEFILPLNSFGMSSAQAVIPRINEARAWGQSPLYLSVVDAINSFGQQDAGANRHVIVITDGANYQYIPPDETNVKETTADDVRDAWAGSSVPVHILGLGMNRTDDEAAIDEFRDLCRDTGGRFEALGGATDLSAALDCLLGPGTYRLEKPTEPVAARSVLGAPIIIEPALKQQFRLAYEGKPSDCDSNFPPPSLAAPVEDILFEGGESLQLFVNEDLTSIEAYPYDNEVQKSAPLIDSRGERTDHLLRVHRAKRDALGRVLFPISWQRHEGTGPNRAWRATNRPGKIWIEVEPLGSSAGPTYVFYDANYEPDLPVPVMNCVAQDWPRGASQARIQVWCRPAQGPEVELLAPAAVADAQAIAVTSAAKPIRIAPGVTMQVDDSRPEKDSRRLRCLLRFEEPAPAVHFIKVDLPETRETRVSRIVRRFDKTHRLSVHDFYFDGEDAKTPDTIHVSVRDQELRDAWRLKGDSLIVNVFESGMFLPVADDK